MTKTIQMYSFEKINCQSSGAFSNNIYTMNNNFSSITLYQLQYNDNIMVSHIKLSQIFKQYPWWIISIFVALYETRYGRNIISCITDLSIIDPFTEIISNIKHKQYAWWYLWLFVVFFYMKPGTVSVNIISSIAYLP